VQSLRGEIVDPERGFQAALQLNPENEGASANFGTLLFAQKRFPEAASHLQRALQNSSIESRDILYRMLSQCGPIPSVVESQVVPPAPVKSESCP
jgi:Tfp pilus assembly protein PilF